MSNMKQIEAGQQGSLVPANLKQTMKDNDFKSSDLWVGHPSKLHVIQGFNPRVDTPKYQAHIRNIANSIKENGFYKNKPLTGYVAVVDGENVVYIYGGHTRLLAVNLANSEGAGVEAIPVIVSPMKELSQDDMLVSLVQDNTGMVLTAYEEAVVCKRLRGAGVSEKAIAARLDRSEAWVASLLTLMGAPFKLRELVAFEKISATAAIDLIKTHGGDIALEKIEAALAAKAANGGKPVRVTMKDVGTKDPFDKVIKKSAKSIYLALTSVKADPGYKKLSVENQGKLNELFEELEKSKATDAGAASNPADDSLQPNLFPDANEHVA